MDNTKLPASFSNSELAAIRLCPLSISTDRSKWVKPNSESDIDISPLVVFPDQPGELAYIFPDTVVIELDTPVAVLEKDGKVIGSPKPIDPNALSPLVQSLFGVKGDYHNCSLNSDGWGVQSYRISTCNIPLAKVVETCLDIQSGKYKYLNRPIRFVRLDVTTNVPAAVEPNEQGSAYLEAMGWQYKNNRHMVGDTCHTYIMSKYADGTPMVETKIYDKFRYMLEVGAVQSYLGDNLANILDSNQDNIRLAFRNPLFHSQGFGRIETRFWGNLPSLSQLVDTHLKAVELLVSEHTEPTSLQDSWDLFLQADHRQTAVVVHNLDTNEVSWTIARWVNRLTDKANGFSGMGLEAFDRAIKHRTMGCYAVDIYVLAVQNKVVTLVSTTHLLPDNLHTAMLVDVGVGKTSKASIVSNGLSWDLAGLQMPFSLANKTGKGRNLKARGEADTSVLEACEFGSVASQEKKLVANERKRQQRTEKALAKIALEVEKDANATAPSDWTKHNHISKLAEVAKPICTRYYYAKDLKYPTYMVKVGKKWYKGNSKLNRLLAANPTLPFAIQVWDSNTVYQNNKIWEVALKPIEG